jgi:hypothetical protein
MAATEATCHKPTSHYTRLRGSLCSKPASFAAVSHSFRSSEIMAANRDELLPIGSIPYAFILSANDGRSFVICAVFPKIRSTVGSITHLSMVLFFNRAGIAGTNISYYKAPPEPPQFRPAAPPHRALVRSAHAFLPS